MSYYDKKMPAVFTLIIQSINHSMIYHLMSNTATWESTYFLREL